VCDHGINELKRTLRLKPASISRACSSPAVIEVPAGPELFDDYNRELKDFRRGYLHPAGTDTTSQLLKIIQK
jgi:hypothetical protein